jgi:ABC-type nitrate/sulfonate/bicarbonate transport system ATPase subunit
VRDEPCILELKNVSKFFSGHSGFKLHVLDNINLKIESSSYGAMFSVLAPFGAGKTSLLKIIAGIEKSSGGIVKLNNLELDHPSGKIVFIPEKPSSFPWLNVKQNIEFVSTFRKYKLNVDHLINLVGLTGYENHFPNERSLGFRFRISLARALAVEPKFILLDDPFKNFLKETKREIIDLIEEVKNSSSTCFILTTTNISDAINLSNEIFLMKNHPGQIFHSIKVERDKIKALDKNYFASIKNQIESSYMAYEGIHLISEIK